MIKLKKEISITRRENWVKYHIPGCSAIHRVKVDAINISAANSLAHEMAKCEVCYHLKKLGKKFITEAVHNRTGLRHDVVCLDDDIKYEIETNKHRAKRFKAITDIKVIELWNETLNIRALVENT